MSLMDDFNKAAANNNVPRRPVKKVAPDPASPPAPGKKDEIVMPSQEFLDRIAQTKGRKPSGKPIKINPEEILSISEAINNPGKVKKSGRSAGKTGDIANQIDISLKVEPEVYQIGELVAGKGVYCGKIGLITRFNMFAAPHDLGFDISGTGSALTATFEETVRHVAALRDYMGHNGIGYKSVKDITAGIKSGTYQGEWFIPILEMLIGKNKDGKIIKCHNLSRHKDEGALRNTFATEASSREGKYDYWSSTQDVSTTGLPMKSGMTSGLCARVDTAETDFIILDDYEALTRLVRLEPVA